MLHCSYSSLFFIQRLVLPNIEEVRRIIRQLIFLHPLMLPQGVFAFLTPLIKTMGIHKPFRVNLVYHFNSKGMFGMPNGWELDVDYI